ncbi:MAG: hypothetical protein WD403_09685, partial [Pirellulales bacterium]
RDTEMFRNYPVLGKVIVENAKERSDLIRELKDAMAKQETQSDCFWPRHAIRVTSNAEVTDYLICFECSNVWVFREGTFSQDPISDGPLELFNGYLRQAGVKLAPQRGEPPIEAYEMTDEWDEGFEEVESR